MCREGLIERPVSFSFDTSFVDRISCSSNRCQSLEMLGRLASQLKFHAVNGKGAMGNESFVRHVFLRNYPRPDCLVDTREYQNDDMHFFVESQRDFSFELGCISSDSQWNISIWSLDD